MYSVLYTSKIKVAGPLPSHIFWSHSQIREHSRATNAAEHLETRPIDLAFRDSPVMDDPN